MAELLLGQPLFPGESGGDQLVEIIKVLGTPTREEIKCMKPNYTEFEFPQIKPHPWHKDNTDDLTRGPRRLGKSIPLGSSAVKEPMGLSLNRYQINLDDLRIEYDDAKFYVIKSYNEDNMHKSVKYNVWSSTPDGNKKLDAAFHEKMAKTSVAGIECPIFLFFSVNGSGQFVGVVEMIGPVDF